MNNLPTDIASALQDQLSIMNLMKSLFYDLSDQDDDNKFVFSTAAAYSLNVCLSLHEACQKMLDEGQTEAAEFLYKHVNEQFNVVEAFLSKNSDGGIPELTEAQLAIVHDTASLRARVTDLEKRLATLLADTKFPSGENGGNRALLAALSEAVKQAAESVVLGEGKPEELFTSEKITQVVEDLVKQILEAGQAQTRADAAKLVDGALGMNEEDKRRFLVADQNNRFRTNTQNGQFGAALSADAELTAATSLTVYLERLASSAALG